MVVAVEEILEEGLELTELVPLDFLSRTLEQEGQQSGFRATRSTQFTASLSKVSGGVLVRGEFTVQLSAPCKRCLNDVSSRIPVSFTLNLISRALVEGRRLSPGEDDGHSARAGSFDLKEADEDWFDGRIIDFDPILREQLLLALPMYLICSEDCKGLCPLCGQDLNVKSCGCEPKRVDPRLAVLKDIKLH